QNGTMRREKSMAVAWADVSVAGGMEIQTYAEGPHPNIRQSRDVAFGVKRTSLVGGCSFDHLVGAGEQRRRRLDAEGLRSFEIDDKLVLCRRLHRQIGWLLALEDAVHVSGGETKLLNTVGTVGNEAPRYGKVTLIVDRGQPVLRG